MPRAILALDQGTTSSRAIVFDLHGAVLGVGRRPLTCRYPQPGWVEQDPGEIVSGQVSAAREALAAAGLSATDIAAIGIANQRETTVVWERATGRPVTPAIVWQCRRTAELCEQLREGRLPAPGGAELQPAPSPSSSSPGGAACGQPHRPQPGPTPALTADLIRDRTGLVIDAYFSATKLRWILDHVPGARAQADRGELLFGTVDTWLIWNLTGGRAHVTDVSNASRTMLLNLHTLRWDEEICEALGLPLCLLPQVLPSSGLLGTAQAEVFGAELPITAAVGDQQGALFGQACFAEGMAKSTYGTGAFLLMNTGTRPVPSRHGLLTTVAWSLGGEVEYALEGSVFVAGAAIQWLRDELGLITTAAESEALARSVPDTGGVYFVPAFVGLGAPYWDEKARGAIVGLTRGTNRAHLVRAALEAMAYQTADVLGAMENDLGEPLSELRVDGGAAENDFLLQLQADILGAPVVRPQVVETTALGAAYLAGLGAGCWASREELAGQWQVGRRFTPELPADDRLRALLGWHRAVTRARDWEQ